MIGNLEQPGKQAGTEVGYRALLTSSWALIFGACTAVLSGCVTPLTLGVMVSDYNQAVMEATSRQLLVNIANARHHKPLQFSEVSNIAATLNFQYNAGVVTALTGTNGGLLVPNFGGSYSENPTISITPVSGAYKCRFLEKGEARQGVAVH